MGTGLLSPLFDIVIPDATHAVRGNAPRPMRVGSVRRGFCHADLPRLRLSQTLFQHLANRHARTIVNPLPNDLLPWIAFNARSAGPRPCERVPRFRATKHTRH